MAPIEFGEGHPRAQVGGTGTEAVGSASIPRIIESEVVIVERRFETAPQSSPSGHAAASADHRRQIFRIQSL